MAERLEDAIGKRADIRGETHAQEIEGIDFTRGMRQPEQVDRRLRPSRSACKEASAPSFVKSRRKEFPVPSGRKPSAMRSHRRLRRKTPLRIS